MPQLLEQVTITARTRIIAYQHFRSGVHTQVEGTELGQPAEDSQVLLVKDIQVQGQVAEVGKTRGVYAQEWEPREPYPATNKQLAEAPWEKEARCFPHRCICRCREHVPE